MEDKEKELEEKKSYKSQEEQIDETTKEANLKFGIDEEVETIDQKVSEIEKRENEIELRLAEIDVLMDKLDIKLSIDDEDVEALREYDELKKEVKALLKEKRNLRKMVIVETTDENQKSLDNLAVWIIFYGFFVSLLSSPLLSSVWVKFAQWIIKIASDSIGAMDPSTVLGKIVVVLLIFAFPLLLHVLSWVLYLNAVKSKTNKFAFRIAWIVQAVCTLITMIIAIVNVLK
ncbi:MAG: hypothetical protein K6E74_04560 [Bacilli bacterium]|nr:hypothetical protein [Bacilli bacterium]